MPFTLETPRLLLRAFEEGDVETFASYRSDPQVALYQGWDVPYSREQAANLIAALQSQHPGMPGEWYQIAIELKTSQVLIGDCCFRVLVDDARQAEIGFTLAQPYQGQGFATEAVTALLDYLFHQLNLHRVRANCDPENETSARLLKRVGMRHEGRFIESLWLRGGWVSEDWYAVLRREWLKPK